MINKTTNPSFINLMVVKSLLNFRTYLKVFNSIYELGYFYNCLILKLTSNRANKHITTLLELNVIQPTELNEEQKEFLISIRGMNKGNIRQIKPYTFTPEGLEFFSNPEVKNNVLSKAATCLKKRFKYMRDLFRSRQEKINKENQEKEILLKIDFEKTLKKTGLHNFFWKFEEIGIDNAHIFMKSKPRDIARAVGIDKDQYERIKRRVVAQMGGWE